MRTPSTRKSRFLSQADRILGKTATAVAVAAGAGLVGEAQQANAQVIYSGPVNIPIPATTSGVYLNVQTGVNGPSPSGVPGWDLNPWSSSSLSWFNPSAPAGGVYVTGGGSSTTLVDNLPIGSVVDGTSVFGSGASESTGATAFNFNSDNNFVGFRFQNEAASNQVQYGWVQVHLGATFTDPARAIIAYAYESSGGGITITPVPEPTSFALLSLGAAGLTAFRRYRRRQAS